MGGDPVIEFLTSRSRRSDSIRCARSRFWLHEAQAGTGWELIKQAVPLATGVSVHAGLAALLNGRDVEASVLIAVSKYAELCKDRGLEIDLLESQSFVFSEQRALTEALVRLAALRVIPQLLETYEVLEVEVMDRRTLYETTLPQYSLMDYDPRNDWKIVWRSIPDALLRHRESGDLYLLSWKTCSDLPREDDSRIDMQGVSEAWAIQERLNTYAGDGRSKEELFLDPNVPGWFCQYQGEPPPQIRGIQMAFLVKGLRRKGSDVLAGETLTPEQLAGGGKVYKTASPLIYGYRDGGMVPKFASSRFYTCPEPHSFRWAKGGVCPGGKNHKLNDDWASFQVWDTLGVKEWMRMLEDGEVQNSESILDSQWALPVPNFRTLNQMENWRAQTQASEIQIAKDLLKLREVEGKISQDDLIQVLNQTSLGTQNTDVCNRWFGRKCPAWDLCWGPQHIRESPELSGMYKEKTQYAPEGVEEG